DGATGSRDEIKPREVPLIGTSGRQLRVTDERTDEKGGGVEGDKRPVVLEQVVRPNRPKDGVNASEEEQVPKRPEEPPGPLKGERQGDEIDGERHHPEQRDGRDVAEHVLGDGNEKR